ncbi:MAG: hypothetical protein K2Y23_02380 [Cyanobacteria bacterium]|nr:hypothetical protein [Cyanobacteriota bacterium]
MTDKNGSHSNRSSALVIRTAARINGNEQPNDMVKQPRQVMPCQPNFDGQTAYRQLSIVIARVDAPKGMMHAAIQTVWIRHHIAQGARDLSCAARREFLVARRQIH